MAGSELDTTPPGPLRLSIAMATHNGARFVDEQLESIASQVRLPDELVVVDDASTDDTPAILRSFRERAPFRVKLDLRTDHAGTARTFDAALARCNGDYLALADQDDVWLPEKLRRLEAAAIAAHAALVFSDADLIDGDGRSLRRRLWSVTAVGPEVISQLESEHAFDALVGGRPITGSTAIFRRDVVAAARPLPDGIQDLIHDAWLAIVAALLGPVVALAEPLVKYRIHRGQQLGVDLRSQFRPGIPNARGVERLLEKPFYTLSWHRLFGVATLLRDRGFPQNVTSELEGRAAHLMHRDRLPKDLRHRAMAVLREWRNGNYRRFSDGMESVVKDLLALHQSRFAISHETVWHQWPEWALVRHDRRFPP